MLFLEKRVGSSGKSVNLRLVLIYDEISQKKISCSTEAYITSYVLRKVNDLH